MDGLRENELEDVRTIIYNEYLLHCVHYIL